MLLNHDLSGSGLPEGTLCLTYDDGPGLHTEELGRYLYAQDIRATFFVVGQAASENVPLLKRLLDWGHLIGNHTWSHAGLVDLALAGGDVVAEVARADEVIRPLVSPPILFRPPYGSWRMNLQPNGPENAPTSLVCRILRESRQFDDYVGPIMWDIVGEDWECWRRGVSVEQCSERHLREIEGKRRGIVLLHDSSEDEAQKAANRTMELTACLVPELKRKDYRFVGLDAVFPEINVQEEIAVLAPTVDTRVVSSTAWRKTV